MSIKYRDLYDENPDDASEEKDEDECDQEDELTDETLLRKHQLPSREGTKKKRQRG